MQDEELMVDVMTNTHSDCMTEADGIITAMESIKDYPSEKVGADGLLELDFTIKEEYLTDAENNPVRFNIQVAKKTKDPADNKKDIFIFVEDQMMQVLSNVEIIRSKDLKTLGIKATKEDKTPFSKEEKIALRKKAICYKNTALMVEKSTLTPEAVENCAVIVEVDEMAEIEKTNSTCVCKEYDLIWGAKVSCEFRKKVVEICKDLWPNDYKKMANGLMAVMNVETAGSFKAHQIMGSKLKDVNKIVKDDFFMNNKKSSRAVGLIQFTQDALVQIGEFTSGTGFDKLHEVKLKLAKMGEVKQLDYVKKYFEESKNKIKTPEDIYLQVFAPSGVGKSDDFVLYDGGENYRQNEIS